MDDSLLRRVRVVLVETQAPGNIGAAQRAMATMGLGSLWLVRPADYPSSKATMMAADAAPLLEQVRVVERFEEAIAGCALVIGTSTRQRAIDWPTLGIDETVAELLTEAGGGEVALVFGSEPAGLTSEQLYRCNFRSVLPTAEDHSSLNLAQAVQVYAFALRRGLGEATEIPDPQPAATPEELDGFNQELMELLVELDFPRRDPDHLALRLRGLFNRARLRSRDVGLLRGMLRRIRERIDSRERKA